MPATRGTVDCNSDRDLFMAIEMSNNNWLLTFGVRGTTQTHRKGVLARDIEGLFKAIALHRRRFDLPDDARVLSCYEAGRDGFWLHRVLAAQGIRNLVIDPASIEMPRRARRAKTDKIDGVKLLKVLKRYLSDGEEQQECSVCRVPTHEQEDLRQINRELMTLGGDRTRSSNRIVSLLATQGIKTTIRRDLRARLEQMHSGDGKLLPPQLIARIGRELDRIVLIDRQIKDVKRMRDELIGSGSDVFAQVRQLMSVRGVAEQSAWLLVAECFGWREIRNRRQLAALVGLAPTPHCSGEMNRELGISKAGNARMRRTLVQLALVWLRWQPDCALVKWFNARFGNGSKRVKRTGIVALARKLIVALWRFLRDGVLPPGTALKPA